ncbi:peroxidase family protein [Longispora fulva]|uniref:Peroxidase n=1 Tax=Longispora fulva TaxID=619741 RepID=A0A8J7GM08_9ACTN|nr:heme peroxidase family protein [Longispora fulva]MBG6135509.1 hypothetical protein [Longispora fulva]
MTEDNAVPRRGFLAGVGAGAAGLALSGHGTAYAAPASGGAPDTTFSRMFPSLPAFGANTNAMQAALLDIGRRGGPLDAADDLAAGPVALITDPAKSLNNPDNPTHTAGTTFLGQFLDHDMTFDAASRLGVATDPATSPNGRVPLFDLDSVYGGGPVTTPMFYDPADRAKFLVESGGLFEDLPRGSGGAAIIAEPRNDENMVISGLHAAFLLFHNRVVDWLRDRPEPPEEVFAAARRLVTRHYHWIILKEFLPQIVGQAVVDRILTAGRQFYKPNHAGMPVEFQGAAYRFGHSMVRPSYRANLAGDQGQPFFGFVFDPAGEGQADPVDLRGGTRAARRFIGWQTFFDFNDGQVKRNKRIDTRISTPLFTLPLGIIPGHTSPTSLAQRNLLRHLTWSMPSGQAIAAYMGTPVLGDAAFPELTAYNLKLQKNTPLWYYVLREAQLQQDGLRLGAVGGTIVAEVFLGLLELDPSSWLNQRPDWRPTLPSRVAGDFRMVDLLTFAGVDPASRGQ